MVLRTCLSVYSLPLRNTDILTSNSTLDHFSIDSFSRYMMSDLLMNFLLCVDSEETYLIISLHLLFLLQDLV